MELRGKVVRKTFGAGTKSEHSAVYLKTDEAEYKLRRLQGNPFHDPELEKLVGKEIRARGTIAGYELLMGAWEET
jgi:hypothetical protein